MGGKRQWREEGSEPERYTEGACIGIQVAPVCLIMLLKQAVWGQS
jgi:hypothetical protein